MRPTYLPFALPDIDEAELNEIRDALDSGWITTGPKVKQFEAEFAAYVGAKHSIAVNSCTAAMHLALEAIGLQRGDIVITTPYTFAATAEVVRYFDAIPLFVDVEPDTLNINPPLLAEVVHDLHQGGTAARRWLPPALRGQSAVLRPPAAIIPVHIAGYPANLEAIYSIAEEYGIPVIEDAAHAFPVKYAGRWIGQAPDRTKYTFPHAVAFSFYATKTITTGEGGMLTTDSDDIADRVRIMSLHGISKDAWKRYSAEGSWYYEIIAPGYKYNMTDIAAAMGLAQLAKAERMWRRRSEIARRYNEAFKDVPTLQTPLIPADGQHAWHLYMLRLNLEHLRIDRARFIEEMKKRNIGTSVHFIPLHLHPYYRQTYGYQPEDFPVAYREYQREVSLPIYSRMSDRDVEDVIEAVLEIVDVHGRR